MQLELAPGQFVEALMCRAELQLDGADGAISMLAANIYVIQALLECKL